MPSVLITGSNGLLGQKLVYLLRERNAQSKNRYQIIACSRGINRITQKEGYTYLNLDITDSQAVSKVFTTYKPDVVINTAAITNVDQCETEPEACDAVNIHAVNYQIQALEKLQYDNPGYNPHFIHLSTDFVFDGQAGPYSESDQPNPISYYGHSKYKAELLVQQSKLNWAVVRTIIVYGVVDNLSRSNLVLWAKEALEKEQIIKVINDQYRAPTLAEDLAEGCMLIAEKKAQGIFNISSSKTYSILELVYLVAEYWNLNKELIQIVSSSTLNQPAKRPPRTGFVIDKAVNVLGFKPKTFKEGLALIDQQLNELNKKH